MTSNRVSYKEKRNCQICLIAIPIIPMISYYIQNIFKNFIISLSKFSPVRFSITELLSFYFRKFEKLLNKMLPNQLVASKCHLYCTEHMFI